MSFRHSLDRSAAWIKRGLARTSSPDDHACASPFCIVPKKGWLRLPRHARILLDEKFYCQSQCLEAALFDRLSRLLAMTQPLPPPNRIPLGLLMVARGKLTHIEVRAALDAQSRDGGGKIGDWFEKLGFASEQDVTGALALQWGCPLASSFDLTAVTSPGGIPLTILEAFQMLPVNHAAATGTLYLAFGERVDHAALYAIERTLNCRTQPCVARRKGVARQLESMRLLSHPNDVEFVTRDLNEMARISLSYVSRLSPEGIRVNRVGRFIWLRFDARTSAPRPISKASSPTNLVFCLDTGSLLPRPPSQESRSSALPLREIANSLPTTQDENISATGP